MRYHAPYGVTDPNAGYVNGDPSIGRAGSIPPAESIEFPQREIVHLIEKAGFSPDDADLYQLTRGVRRGKFAYGVDTGSQNAPSIALDPPLTAMAAAGTEIRVRFLYTNSLAVAITINGLPPTPIVHNDGTALDAGDIHANGIGVLISDGTVWQLANSLGGNVTVSGDSNGLPYGVDFGTTNHIKVTAAPVIATLYPGLAVLVKLLNNVTGASDFQPNGLAVKTIKWPDGSGLVNGDGIAGGIMLLCYDGAFWQLLNFISRPTAGGSTGTMDPGDVVIWPLETPKPGTFECNGQAVSRTTYANLFAKIGTTHGVGDGSATFNVPDYRGFFLRGWSHGSGNDPDAGLRLNRGDGVTGDRVGTGQADGFKSHQHTGGSLSGSSGSLYIPSGSYAGWDWMFAYDYSGLAVIGNPEGGSLTVQNHGPASIALSQIAVNVGSITGNTDPTGGNETRGKNKTVMFCIAY